MTDEQKDHIGLTERASWHETSLVLSRTDEADKQSYRAAIRVAETECCVREGLWPKGLSVVRVRQPDGIPPCVEEAWFRANRLPHVLRTSFLVIPSLMPVI